MYIKKKKASTDAHLRSLVQKATRRGFSSVSRAALSLLKETGDDRWIRSRCAVLAAEECWPALEFHDIKLSIDGRIEWLAELARSEKHKDAAGLGSLAYAASEDDLSIFNDSHEDSIIRTMAAAIRRPVDFWSWLLQEAEKTGVVESVEKIRRFGSWPTWPWDKAFVLSSAYLRVTKPTINLRFSDVDDRVFPFWVAIDKHTDEGKQALRTTAKRIGVSYRQLNWVSYYFESAVVNALATSPWWIKERDWRLRKVGLTVQEAQDIWSHASHLVSEAVQPIAEALKHKVMVQTPKQENLV